MMLALERPWIRKPPQSLARINWQHPLSEGLIWVSLMNEGGGDGVYNLVDGTFVAFTKGTGSDPAHVIVDGELAVNFPDHTDAQKDYIDTGMIPDSTWKSHLMMVRYNNATDQLSHKTGSDDQTNGRFFRLGAFRNAPDWISQSKIGDANLTASALLPIVVGQWHTHVDSLYKGTFYSDFDGVEIGTDTTVIHDNTNTFNYVIGATTRAQANGMQADIGLVIVSAKEWDKAERQQLYSNPYCFLKPRTIYVGPNLIKGTILAHRRRVS